MFYFLTNNDQPVNKRQKYILLCQYCQWFAATTLDVNNGINGTELSGVMSSKHNKIVS